MQDEGLQLYRRFLDGDTEALEQLIAFYKIGLLRFLYGYLHDFALAEDVLSDVFVTLYFKKPKLSEDSLSFKTYLFTVARNRALNLIKRKTRRKETSLEALSENAASTLLSDEEQAFLSQTPPSPERILEREEERDILHAAMQNLKTEYREALELRYFEDLPPEAIAKITKRNIKQVYNILARARATLKETLQSGGYYENE